MNQTMKPKQNHRHKEQTGGYHKGRASGRGEWVWEVGVSGCKLFLHRKGKQQVLLDSAEKYIHYPMINHSGQECKNNVCIYMCVCMCITEPLCYIAELTQHCKSIYFNKNINKNFDLNLKPLLTFIENHHKLKKFTRMSFYFIILFIWFPFPWKQNRNWS